MRKRWRSESAISEGTLKDGSANWALKASGPQPFAQTIILKLKFRGLGGTGRSHSRPRPRPRSFFNRSNSGTYSFIFIILLFLFFSQFFFHPFLFVC